MMAFVGRKVITTAALIVVLGVPGIALGRGQVVQSAVPKSASWQVVISLPSSHVLTGLAIDMRGNPDAAKWAYAADSSTQRIVTIRRFLHRRLDDLEVLRLGNARRPGLQSDLPVHSLMNC